LRLAVGTSWGNLPVPPDPFHWSASRTGATRRIGHNGPVRVSTGAADRGVHRIGHMAASSLTVGDRSYEIFRLDGVERLPYTLRILLENVIRHGEEQDAEAIAGWDANAEPTQAISYRPARV